MQPKLILKEIANTIHSSKDRYTAHEKVKKYFGWEPKTSFNKGLDITIDWYKKYLKENY